MTYASWYERSAVTLHHRIENHMLMKMEIKACKPWKMLHPAYMIELGMAAEPDHALVESGLRGIMNRFPGMRLVACRRPSLGTNVRFSVSTALLDALAHGRGCTTTELLASIIQASQEDVWNSTLFRKGSRPRLYVSENPCSPASFQLYRNGSMRRSRIPAFGCNSRTFCNLGELYLSDELAGRLCSFDFRISRQPGRGNACTAFNFGGRTIINCSRRIREHEFEYFFFERLRAAGLDAVVEQSPKPAPLPGCMVRIAYRAL